MQLPATLKPACACGERRSEPGAKTSLRLSTMRVGASQSLISAGSNRGVTVRADPREAQWYAKTSATAAVMGSR